MTSLSPIGNEPQSLEGRSVRDVVEYTPELVNEVWCRKIFRQILQSLELQYAMQMPHRAITPDTIVFHQSGEPLLDATMADDESTASEADDLNALARIIHYAITRELLPAGPLRGRALEGYSDSLVTAVDRCMAPDPAERPQNIAELRELLGIVSLGSNPNPKPAASTEAPAAAAAPKTTAVVASAAASEASAPAQAMPAPAPTANTQADPFTPRRTGMSRRQRWAIAAGGVAVLAAIALAVFAEMRDSGSFDHIVLTQPQAEDGARAAQAGAPAPARAQEPAAAAATPAPAAPPPTANSAAATLPAASDSANPSAAPDADAPADGTATTATADAGASPTDQAPASAHAAPGTRAAGTAAGASYRLRIQPWGAVYVDGIDRGVSPPIKRLTLAPGKHTLRVTNPAFQDRVLEIDTARGGGQVAVDFNDAR